MGALSGWFPKCFPAVSCEDTCHYKTNSHYIMSFFVLEAIYFEHFQWHIPLVMACTSYITDIMNDVPSAFMNKCMHFHHHSWWLTQWQSTHYSPPSTESWSSFISCPLETVVEFKTRCHNITCSNHSAILAWLVFGQQKSLSAFNGFLLKNFSFVKFNKTFEVNLLFFSINHLTIEEAKNMAQSKNQIWFINKLLCWFINEAPQT